MRPPNRLVALGLYSALTAFVTWPQVIAWRSVNDFGDPLLNAWILAWVAHALASGGHGLFDANIFFPERHTLAYSETLLVPALLMAPLLLAHVDPVIVHNIVLLGSFVLSGVATYWLVDELTGDRWAALVAGAIFCIYPYRIEAYGHLQLQIAFWIPLALGFLHRGIRGDWRLGALAGAMLALELYTSLYLAIDGALLAAIVGIGTVLVVATTEGRRWRAGIAALALTFSVLGVAAWPLVGRYDAAAQVVGERTLADVRQYSAEPRDYLRAMPENALYGDDAHPGVGERRLFPGFGTAALAATGLATPLGAAAYGTAALVSWNLSLGTNGVGYEWLFTHARVIRALRVPARLALLVGLALAVLTGLGLSRSTRGRTPRTKALVAALALLVVAAEGRNRPLDLSEAPEARPDVYRWLATQPAGPVCEWPVGNLGGRIGPQDPTYEYYSTLHWRPLVNGYSGFEPASYRALKDGLQQFPSPASTAVLAARHVKYLLVHSGFYVTGDYNADIAALRADTGLSFVRTFAWKDGSQTAVFAVFPVAPASSSVPSTPAATAR